VKYLLTILLIALSSCLVAQDIKKGFKSLEKSEYDKAKEAFQKNLSDDPRNVGANFGMALVLADDQSPVFDIMSAWEYVERIQGRLGELSQEDIDVLSEYFLNTEVRKTSRPVKKKMEIALEAIEARLIKYIREENNLDACYDLLKRYPDFRHYDNVIHIRNQFEYRKYEKLNTLAAFDEFIQKFPEAAQVPKAKKQRYHLAFEEAKTANTIEAYAAYIAQFPESDYLQSAIKLRNEAAFKQAQSKGTLPAFEHFIATYPDALEVSDARVRVKELLYEQAKRIKSMQAFNDFIKQYPDGQYFVDIFNLKATELGNAYVTEFGLQSPAIQWARAFDNNGRIEEGGIVKSTSDGGMVIACTSRDNDSASADAWVIKLDPQGNMLWNKTIGQAFEDQVTNVLIDHQGGIIVVGYTWLSADSASKKGWMFKLAADGTKLWNKNLGAIDIASSALDADDRIYIGGGIAEDSLGMRYAFTTFSSDAKKIGEKHYTGLGEIHSICFIPEGNMLLGGSNWLVGLENKRYLRWDVLLDAQYTITHGISAGGNFLVAGFNDQNMVYGSYSANGAKNWFQNYPKSDSSQVIASVAATPQGQFVVLEQKDEEGKIKVFQANGTIAKVKQVSPALRLESCYCADSRFLLVMNNKDIVLLNLSDTMAF